MVVIVALQSLELVENGAGELVGGGLAAHVASADLAAWALVYSLEAM
jgi:hypothetical protein